MSIATNNIVTFQDLYNSAWSYIKNRCQNIDKFNVPAEAKSGWSKSISTGGPAPSGDPGEKAPARYNDAVGGGANISIDNNTAISLYSSSVVEAEFKNFLSSRGVFDKKDKIITSSGIIMFWSAVASFYSSACVTLVGEFFDVNASNCIVYYPTSNYAPIPSVTDACGMSNDDVNKLLNNLLASLNMNNRVHKINYNLTPYSSSSSSSSSSCSSSSYIGYIKIGGVNG